MKSKLFFWSDPHFGHSNAIEFCDRPFDSVEEMNKTLIQNYNAVVSEIDTVVWVGDCFFNMKSDQIQAVMRALNGHKILVRGNHDRRRIASAGFDFICEDMTIRIGKTPVTVCHYPFRPSGLRARIRNFFHPLKYWDRRPPDHGGFHIHGHTHNKLKGKGRMIHVGVDAHNFTPVPAQWIESYISLWRNKNDSG